MVRDKKALRIGNAWRVVDDGKRPLIPVIRAARRDPGNWSREFHVARARREWRVGSDSGAGFRCDKWIPVGTHGECARSNYGKHNGPKRSGRVRGFREHSLL